MADTTDKRVKDLLERYAAGERDFARLELSGANFSEAKLMGANFREANFVAGNLRGADLSGADLRGVTFTWADLTRADLSRTKPIGANLTEANLLRAKLTAANIDWANLRGAFVEGADFGRATCGGTAFVDMDLRQAVGLEEISHAGPSPIGIDTLYKSHGEIPEAFMRGCGVPDEFITLARSLVGKAIDFYSCFISYSSNDDDFAKRLHADLQASHVRCWFAPEDLKIGDKFRQKIDETIRVYDKVIVVLSETSIASDWVESEIEAALEKERRTKKTVLFPIRIDDAVMGCEVAWAADVRRTRQIGEFTRWKEHDVYKKALERVLRDLKAENVPEPA